MRIQQQTPSRIPSPANTNHDANAIRGLVSSLMDDWWESHSIPNQSSRQAVNQEIEDDDHSQSRESTMAASYQASRKRRCPEPDRRECSTSAAQLPPDKLVNVILDAYFSVVHPFIPIIHEMLFRSRLRDPTERPKLIVVVHAMMVCALRYVANERLSREWLEQYPDALKRSREFVVLSGMDGLSVENLQALIIVAFVHIGDGDASKAWPIIGTLSRAVVYLGLHCEPEEDQPGEPYLKPLRCLTSARVWTEAEERRRVFWNVFLLDRFCSTVTGYVTLLFCRV